jgi:D-glycero-alpha-D-manno-heptose 1-phosphate guanylyltransferase
MKCEANGKTAAVANPSPDSCTKGMTAVVLAGGLGTRLRTVLPSTPKALAPVGNLSFLELLTRQLRHQGIRRIVMCTGYLGDQIEDQFGDGHCLDVAITYSRELEPMGTAGAVKLARRHLEGESEFIVLNGDSFIDIDFHQLIRFHCRHGGLMTIAARRVEDTHRYGTIEVSGDDRVVSFMEKTGRHAPGLVNVGVYVFNAAVLEHICEGPASLERDVFPQLLDCGAFAFQQDGIFIDIGTPQDYARAEAIHDRLRDAAFGNALPPYQE